MLVKFVTAVMRKVYGSNPTKGSQVWMLNQLEQLLLKTIAMHILNNLEYSQLNMIQCVKGRNEKNVPL